MLFRLTSNDQLLSWRIAKNPDGAPFERELTSSDGSAVIRGRYTDPQTYEVVVHNSTTYFADLLRKANAATYVTPLPYVVCPLNLRGIATAFRSAMLGQNQSGGAFTDDQLNAPTTASVVVGPIPCVAFEACVRPFAELGISATIETTILSVPDPSAAMIRLEMTNAMPLSTFLQKIYVVLYVVTRHLHIHEHLKSAQLDKILRLSEQWLHVAPCRRFIVKRLAGHVKGLESKLDAAIDAAHADPSQEQANVDEKAGKEAVAEKRVSLHEQRHKLILSLLPPHATAESMSLHGDLTLVDFGSSEGKLATAIAQRYHIDSENEATTATAQVKVIAVEGSAAKAERLRRKLDQSIRILHGNLVALQNYEEIIGCDVLIMSEVIEHLCALDRSRLIAQVRDFYRPQTIIITTPNIEANPELCRLAGKEWDGGYRDRDHQIEYTAAQCFEEIVLPLSVTYDVESIPIWPKAEQQPSFVLKATRREGGFDGKAFDRHRHRLLRMCDGLYVPDVDHHVTPKDINMGLTSWPVMGNGPNIFWLGSSIAPCDWSELAPEHLEHPHGAFEYFRRHGVNTVIEQPKLMGCRMYVLAFRDPAMAAEMGYAPIIANARSGGPFFPPHHKFLADLQQGIAQGLEEIGMDYVILDGELLPWSTKEHHITPQFRMPGEAMALWRMSCDPSKLEAALRFVRTVNHFAAPAELSYHPFSVPAIGQITRVRGTPRFSNTKSHLGLNMYPHSQQLVLLQLSDGFADKKPFSPINSQLVDLRESDEVDASIERWTKLTECESGEGFVFKPLPRGIEQGRCSHVWPGITAMKVRGREYLRIIYGADYTDAPFFEQLKHRRTAPKRELSVVEDRLAEGILRTFISSNRTEHIRHVAAFLATDHVRGANIDKTL